MGVYLTYGARGLLVAEDLDMGSGWQDLLVGVGGSSCHRSHFGSRYTLGCCASAGLWRFLVLVACWWQRIWKGAQAGKTCWLGSAAVAVTVAILAQGTHLAVALAQAYVGFWCSWPAGGRGSG